MLWEGVQADLEEVDGGNAANHRISQQELRKAKLLQNFLIHFKVALMPHPGFSSTREGNSWNIFWIIFCPKALQ